MIKDTVRKMLGQGYAASCKLGFKHLREGEYKDSIVCFDQSIAANPKYLDAYMGKGACLIKMGYCAPALNCYNKVLELDPRHMEAAFQKGVCQVYLGLIEEALQSFDLVLDINPNNDAAWDNKAVCYQLLGNRTKAEQCISIGMHIRGEFRDYQPLLGKWYSSR